MLTFQPFQTSTVWKLPDPDTGFMHTGTTRAQLVSNINNYRSQNRLDPLTRLDLVIDNYLCSLPENIGKCKPAVLQRGFLQYFKGGLALVSKLWYGDKNMVPQSTADERSSICKDCTFNVFPDRGMFIQWSDDIALHSTGGKKSLYHDKLGNCSCCTCPLRAKVFYKGPFNLSKEERMCMEGANVACWQLHEK